MSHSLLSTSSFFIFLISFTSFHLNAQFDDASLLYNEGVRIYDFVHGDMDNDGDQDLIFTEDQELLWSENDGTGNLLSTHFITSVIDNDTKIQVGDINNDGDLDIVVAANGNQVIWIENLGGGTFDEATPIATSDYTTAGSMCLGDTDGDGLPEIFLFTRIGSLGTFSVFQNEGDGTFTQSTLLEEVGGYVTGEAYAEDIDLDGDIDFISNYTSDIALVIFENNGNGDFESQVIPYYGDYWLSLCLSDLDNDGDSDILLGNCCTIFYIENFGDGSYGDLIEILGNQVDVQSLDASDLDLDGDMDIIVTNQPVFDDNFYIENTGNWTFSAPVALNHPDFIYPYQSSFVDMNGDGAPDVVTSFIGINSNGALSGLGMALYMNNLAGCMDPEACNYSAIAIVDHGCCYGNCGCKDPVAVNFDADADCNNPSSCRYRIEGMVFHDENGNGIKEPDEYGLSNQQLSIQPMGWISSTNDNGEFNFVGPETGSYSIELSPDDLFPFISTNNPQELNVIWNQEIDYLYFGLSDDLLQFGISVDFYPPGAGYPCNDWVNDNICYRNEGNVPIDGVVEVEYDERFQDFAEVTPIDSVVENRIYMSFENLLPGQMFCYDVNFLSPNVEFIGETITSTARIYGFYEEELAVYGDEELNVEMTCAYDPNDKQAFPLGYHDDHLILNDTEIEFLVRFQNTGNAPATNVLVTDTIDEYLDLSSFSLLANSHSVVATVKPEIRVIEFLFENIMLPDSTNNEPESHGLVSFLITPNENLEPGTEINNTANIYFDNNPPIITNTTWHTIHECGGEAAYTSEVDIYCSGYHTSLEATYPLAETYRWSAGDEIISNESSVEQILTELGAYDFELEVSNPLCSDVTSITVEVEDYSNAPSCPGDINCNGVTGLEDLTLLLAGYGCSDSCEYDLNNDGITSFGDVQVFLSYYGTGCEE